MNLLLTDPHQALRNVGDMLVRSKIIFEGSDEKKYFKEMHKECEVPLRSIIIKIEVFTNS